MSVSSNAFKERIQRFLLTILFSLPLIGQMLRDLRSGRDSALGFFGANILMAWLFAGLMWGIPGMLAGAYVLLPCAAVCLLTIMRA